ncbi:MAG: hypothetical protein JW993_16105 [Sedimentisphaerales bacterium]|nr:hypothetical protein [Sedimentisphaerales bacterium]
MKRHGDIERFLKDASIKTCDAMNERVRGRMREVYASSTSRPPNVWKLVFESRAVRLAAAAAIVTGTGILAVHLVTARKAAPVVPPMVAKSPLGRTTALSLSLAYKRGGMEAVDRLYEKATEERGPGPTALTIEELIAEDNNL